jgi:peptide/nickel transport system ATP-binding protein
VLEVSGLTVEFRQRGGKPFRAVDNLSFALRAGQTLALVGESGSGKSTVVRALAQLQKRAAGEIMLDGRPAARRGRALRAYRHEVQLVFQDPFASLNPMHTVRHHLARPLLLRPDRPRGEAADRAVHDLLRSVNLTPPEEVAAKHPHELSGGQRQRVAIARALATDPGVLLADEPVSMLDVSIRLEILNLLDRLKRDRNLAMLYVTHDLATARHFSAEIMVMYRGEIVEHGPSDSVILSPAHPYTQILAGAAPDPSASRLALAAARRQRQGAREARAAQAVRDIPSDQGRRAPRDAEMREAALGRGCRFRTRCPRAMPVCATHPPDVMTAPGHRALCWLYAPGGGDGPGSAAGPAARTGAT